MNGAVLLITFVQALWDTLVRGFLDRPLLFTLTLAWVIAAGVCAWDLLERRGWRGTAWGVVSAACFALWVAIA